MLDVKDVNDVGYTLIKDGKSLEKLSMMHFTDMQAS